MMMPQYVEARLYILTAMFILAFLVGALFDDLKNRSFIRYLVMLLTSNIFMLLSEAAVLMAYDMKLDSAWVSFFKTIHYIGGTFVIIFYSYCILALMREKYPEVKLTFSHITAILCILFLIFIVISILTDTLLDFDSEGQIIYTSLSTAGRVIMASSVILTICSVIIYCRHLGFLPTLSVFILSFLPILSRMFKNSGDSMAYLVSTAFSTVFLYMVYHRITYQKYIQHEKQLAESRISSMVSQIHPHFIFNTLTAIKYLCKTDPEAAQETIENFSFFLRGSLEALTDSKCVTVEHEIEITNNYVYVQKQRFGDILKVEWDVRETCFTLPVLTIQPLVENAITHGIRQRVEGGTVKITIYSDDEYYITRVEDNGVGFDTTKAPDDGRQHIGLENVRNRLELMSDGKLIITSTQNVGTVAEIKIPKNKPRGKRK